MFLAFGAGWSLTDSVSECESETLRVRDHPVCAASVASQYFLDGAATPPSQGFARRGIRGRNYETQYLGEAMLWVVAAILMAVTSTVTSFRGRGVIGSTSASIVGQDELT